MSQFQVSTLIAIPPEVRFHIYNYLLRGPLFSFGAPRLEAQASTPPLALKSDSISTSILAVCRLFYREGHCFLFRSNTFAFLSPLTAVSSSPFPDSALSCLRTVILGPYQCTARAATADMTATRQFIQSACPQLEILSTRLWLVKHTGAEIDGENDVAPIVDTTWFFDGGNPGPEKHPVRYTMGIIKTGNAMSNSGKRGIAEVDVYSVLFAGLVEEEKRANLFGVWTLVSLNALVNMCRNMRCNVLAKVREL